MFKSPYLSLAVLGVIALGGYLIFNKGVTYAQNKMEVTRLKDIENAQSKISEMELQNAKLLKKIRASKAGCVGDVIRDTIDSLPDSTRK
jgi:uncharacterized membrane protein (DUF106 family)